MHLDYKKIYLYSVSLVSLLVLMFGTISLLNAGLKYFIFTEADNWGYYETVKGPEETSEEFDRRVEAQLENSKLDRTRNLQRDMANGIATLVVAAPIYAYHWSLVRKEHSEK